MARSFRKNPICGSTTARSDAWDKDKAHRRLRRLNRELNSVKRIVYGFDPVEVTLRDVSDPWSFNKDGKIDFRRTLSTNAHLLRK